MISKNLCILLLRAKVASALEGLRFLVNMHMNLHCTWCFQPPRGPQPQGQRGPPPPDHRGGPPRPDWDRPPGPGGPGGPGESTTHEILHIDFTSLSSPTNLYVLTETKTQGPKLGAAGSPGLPSVLLQPPRNSAWSPKMYWFLYTALLSGFWRCNWAPWKKNLISSPETIYILHFPVCNSVSLSSYAFLRLGNILIIGIFSLYVLCKKQKELTGSCLVYGCQQGSWFSDMISQWCLLISNLKRSYLATGILQFKMRLILV